MCTSGVMDGGIGQLLHSLNFQLSENVVAIFAFTNLKF